MSGKSQHMWWMYVKSQFSRREFHSAVYTTFVQEWGQNSPNTAYGGGGGERSPPMLTQLVSRRAAEEHGTEGWARHSVAAETRGPGVWFSKSSGQAGWFKPFFLETSRLRYLTSVSGKTKTFRCSFVSYWAGKVLSGGLRPARKSEFTFRLKNHTHKQAGLWRE